MSEIAGLEGLKVYHLVVSGAVETPLGLPEDQPGKVLRGAFCDSLLTKFCNNKAAASCAECPLHLACPVSALVAPLRDENLRGRDIPRPYGIRPPERGGPLLPGTTLRFGLTLFGKMLPLLPYVIMAAHAMGRNGLGVRAENGRRGRFSVTAVESVNILNGQRQNLLNERQQISFPELAITTQDVALRANNLSRQTLEITYLTPLRLVDQGELVRRPTLRPLVQRLFERLSALNREYGEAAIPEDYPYRRLLEQAEAIKLVEDNTVWHDIGSFSSRQKRVTPIGGLLGKARYEGPLTELLPWLVWGEAVQVGKDTVKGNGWYRLVG